MIQERYTWRTARPVDRDATQLFLLFYRWNDAPSEEGTVDRGESYVLSLTPDPHWVSYNVMGMIRPTFEISGIDSCRYISPDMDMRVATERLIDSQVKRAVEGLGIAVLPPVTFDEGG